MSKRPASVPTVQNVLNHGLLARQIEQQED